MIIIKRLFAEKILAYHENTERLLSVLYSMPGLGESLKRCVAASKSGRVKHIFGVLAQIFVIMWEIIKKTLFVVAFMWLPYRLFSKEFPLISEQRTLVIVFLFFIICIICGSVTNNMFSAVSKRDDVMTKVVFISPAVNYLGKLISKMIADFMGFFIALIVVKVPVHMCLILAVTTVFARPVGELFTMFMYEKSKVLYNNKGAVYGTIMALSLIGSYGSMFLFRTVDSMWMIAVNPVLMMVVMLLGALSFLVLCNYRNYAGIMNRK